MYVSHHGDEHLLRLSSEEVALLVDLCHAGVCSDLLGDNRSRSARVMRFMGDLQNGLFHTAQQVWFRQRATP